MKTFGHLVKLLLLVAGLALFGCGSSDSGGSLAGKVSFPKPAAAKAAAGDLYLAVYDLAGTEIDRAELIADPNDSNAYTYTTKKLDRNKDYILIAVRENQEMLAIVDKASFAQGAVTQEVNSETTAITILIKEWLTAEGLITNEGIHEGIPENKITEVSQKLAGDYKPAAVKLENQANLNDLVALVTTALEQGKYPSTETAVLNEANKEGKYTVPTTPTPGATYAINGKVTDAAGKGIAGVTVTLEGKTATTDTDGKYSFTGLANKTYTITVAKEGISFSPGSISAKVENKNLADQDFLQLVEKTAVLASNEFFTFVSGTIPAAIPSEIMYNDLNQTLYLPHAVALQAAADAKYDAIIKAPYGKYKDSNFGNDDENAFPATKGTVYIFRSFVWGDGETTENQICFYKLEITEATKKAGDTAGSVKFRYAPILAYETVDASGEWEFQLDGNKTSHLSVMDFATMIDFHPENDVDVPMFMGGSLSYTSKDTIAGRFQRWIDNAPEYYDGSIKFTLKDGKLDALIKIGDETYDRKGGVDDLNSLPAAAKAKVK